MALWRVDITGVSSRFVEAESADQARSAVREMIAQALDVRASPATDFLQERFDEAGPIQRRRLLESLDSLVPPSAVRGARTARRQLARQVRYDIQRREAIKRMLPIGPVAPETADTLARHTEMARLGLPAVEKLLRDQT